MNTDFVSLIRQVFGAGSSGNSGGESLPLCFPAHVLDVCMDENSSLYNNDPTNIGKIKFRNLTLNPMTPLSEEELLKRDKGNEALPADRSNIKYPYPGEQVLIIVGVGDKTLPNKGTVAATFYYVAGIATNNSVTFNSQPFVGSKPSVSSPGTPAAISKNRLLAGIKDLSKVITADNSPKIYKQLKPHEGDYILQGRFGNSVRFGSTSAIDESQVSGASGDPITIIRVDRANTDSSKDMLIKEDIDADDSSIYLCSSQKVDLSLSSTNSFKAWKHTLGVESDVETDDKLGLKNKNNLKANNYAGGSQIIITSERIVLNARSSYLMLFGGDGVAINSPKPINIESDEVVTLYGNGGVYLGVPNKGEKFPPASGNATYNASGYEPIALGNKLKTIIDDLIEVIKKAKINFSTSGIPWESSTLQELSNLQATLPEMLSTTVFVDGISTKAAEASATQTDNLADNTNVVGSTTNPVTSQVGSNQPSNPVNTTPSQATNIPPQGSAYSETETINLYNDPV